MSSPDTKQNDSGRIRSSRACLHCSRRKVKCDGLQPCNNCTKESVVCEYGAQKKRGPPKGCDPRGGRKKKVQEPPSTTLAKRKAPSSSKKDPPPSNTKEVPIAAAPIRKPSTTKKSAASSSSSSQPSQSDHESSRLDPPKRDLQASQRGVASTSQPAIASLTARPSSDARSFPNERSTAPWHLSSSSQAHHDPHRAWSRPSAPQPSRSSPSLSRHSSYLADITTAATTLSSHSFPAAYHAPQHASADHKQPYPHAPSPLHHHDSYHPSSHSCGAGPSSAVEPALPLQPASSGQHYDAYPLQAPMRDFHRSSPLASHPSMLPPHAFASAMSSNLPSHPPQDAAGHTPADRAEVSTWSSGRSNTAASATTFASPRSHATRSLYESPVGHYQSGTSPFDRASAMLSASTLSSRHPVSASRLTEPSSGSTTQPGPANAASSSSHNTGVSTSPALTGHPHAYSPSSTAMPHRPWYNGSQPSSPRDPNSISRSQISSPGANWLDHHIRPASAAANHPHVSSRVHLEDRLPPHILQRLLDIYQVFVHPHWPVIYLPSVTSLHSLKRSRPIVFEAILAVASNTFDAYLDAAADDDRQSSNPVLELLYAESPQGTEPSWKSNELRDHFVHRVKTRIFEGKFTQDVGTIQAAILISVIELGCGNPSSAFQFGGIACRMALDMNLHRCTTQSSSAGSSAAQAGSSSGGQSHYSPAQNGGDTNNGKTGQYRSSQLQERLRTFWACFILDKILSTALDKPAQLRSAEIEADWPSVQEADEYDLWLNETTRKFVEKSQLPRLEGVKVHALSSFKAWAEVMAILERILEEVYSPQAKRDRRRTNGASDYEALLRLNDRLTKWRADLPSHLKWSGTWTSPELLSSTSSQHSSADRKESEPHRGLPPQILTLRSWYCICLIILHRPRVPKLLEGPKERGAASAEESAQVAAKDAEEPTSLTKKGKKGAAQPAKKGAQASEKDKRPEPAGLDICNAAAKEVCDILHVYGSSFRIRKISSSWVYLIFQSATIHAAIAASKSVVAFKARQSSIWSRRGSKTRLNEPVSSAADSHSGNNLGAPMGSEDDPEMHAGGGDEAHHVTEADLEGSSELVKTSARYLAECVRFLKRIGPTWKSASNHVAVLRNLCIASVQARPHSPTVLELNGNDQRAAGYSGNNSMIKHEDQHGSASASGTNRADLSSSGGLDVSHHGLQHQIGQNGPIVPSQHANGGTQQHGYPTAHHDQQIFQGHDGKAQSLNMADAPAMGIGSTDHLQAHFLHPPGYPRDQMQPPNPCLAVQQRHPHQQQHHHHHHQHHPQMQQALYPINANDSAFWASMPVASERYNEWDEFFKAFNPSSASTDVASQNANYHPTAAMDLITALQDPNRLLSGLGPQQGPQQ
ncbi:uncharacterized protein UDID_08870 [Ustilago sp. UG-2017a]|nr:uncharacterized protein UDID_08870 [Ustilago sp. UG-2017a]